MNFTVYLEKNISNKNQQLIDDKGYQIKNISEILNLPSHSWILFSNNDRNIKSIIPNLTNNFTWLIDRLEYPLLTAQELTENNLHWIAKTEFIQIKFAHKLRLLSYPFLLLQELIKEKILTEIRLVKSRREEISSQNKYLSSAKILAVIPHLNCNQWLDYCLSSLVNQTVSLTNIVVIDDNSEQNPEIICQRYPQVTLLKTPQSVGPYQIIQSIIKQTSYDAYLFQDADDWSTPQRLEILLELMNQTDADVVGTQECRVDEINHVLTPVCYPLDVNLALKEKPGHALLHPTSLIRRSAILKLNGFANGLLFGGDTEFLLRAHFQLKIRNSPQFCYFRRKRVDSLTTSPVTGLDSDIRKDLLKKVKTIAYNNYQRVNQGKQPLIQPLVTQDIINFDRICGEEILNKKIINN